MKPHLQIPPLHPDQFDAALDAALRDDSLEPSSGFTGSVMTAIRAEAAAPAPIPFPWRRAIPGILAATTALALLLAVLVTGVRLLSSASLYAAQPPAATGAWPASLASPAAQGILIAALVTAAALVFCGRMLVSSSPRP